MLSLDAVHGQKRKRSELLCLRMWSVFIREEVLMSLSVTEKFAYLHPAEAQQRLDSKRTLRPQRLAFGQPVWTEKSKMDCFKGCSIGDTLLNKDCSSLEHEKNASGSWRCVCSQNHHDLFYSSFLLNLWLVSCCVASGMFRDIWSFIQRQTPTSLSV